MSIALAVSMRYFLKRKLALSVRHVEKKLQKIKFILYLFKTIMIHQGEYTFQGSIIYIYACLNLKMIYQNQLLYIRIIDQNSKGFLFLKCKLKYKFFIKVSLLNKMIFFSAIRVKKDTQIFCISEK